MPPQNHKWRRETSFWDDLEVPAAENGPHLFSWLEAVAPDPEEHDYILYTDGSGCTKGWGSSAAVISKVSLNTVTGFREVMNTPRIVMTATYGSTVQRCELSAFLDGIHEILRMRSEDFLEWEAEESGSDAPKTVLGNFTGADRVSVLWYTDRMNLAKSLLFDEYGDALNARKTEVDLWMRYSAMARYVCVTPMHLPRNEIENQKLCDTLCGVARKALIEHIPALAEATGDNYTIEQWNQKQPQKALF